MTFHSHESTGVGLHHYTRTQRSFPTAAHSGRVRRELGGWRDSLLHQELQGRSGGWDGLSRTPCLVCLNRNLVRRNPSCIRLKSGFNSGENTAGNLMHNLDEEKKKPSPRNTSCVNVFVS